MNVVSIVGARPQFVKAAAMSRELRKQHSEILVHTGQHYDDSMSKVFFDELELPKPDFNLEVGSASHAQQTAKMLAGLERILTDQRPDTVLIYGDTNSTLAGALAASKLDIPVAHVEAGLRSFNRAMPEEINRVLADRISSILLCPSRTAVENLEREGVTGRIALVGDIMHDALHWAANRACCRMDVLSDLGLERNEYLLATVHRAENTDNPERLRAILEAFNRIEEPIMFPAHPRTRKAMEQLGDFTPRPGLRIIEPLGYLNMVILANAARLILTDSGGLQKEAYWLGVPCVTLRDETEWVETVQVGWNLLAGADTENICEAVHTFEGADRHPELYGDSRTAEKSVEALASLLS